ncbi:MAG TPA: YjgN family protein, partial [Burkholderiaceae bacterium]|nr:YjgN family protein [Burkholderiaceae bacterium]
MIDTIPMPLGAAGGGTTAPPRDWRLAGPERHPLAIEFSGSGSEYFRIWSVNLLLTLVTLGLYYPWAKVRRLRYFYGNTSIGGHALDFHGDPMKMLRGFLLVGAMVGLYSFAGQVSPLAGLIAFVLVAAVWPALLRASQRFRLANTSWRGLRFRFDGDLRGAYMAMLPLFVPGALSLLGGLAGGNASRGGTALASLGGLAALALLPLFFWRLKRYQHNHYVFGQLRTELRVGAGSFYLLGLKTIGVAIGAALLVGALAAVVGGFAALSAAFNPRQANPALTIIGFMLLFMLAYVAVILVVYPYATAQLQNLVWNGTRGRLIEFESDLRFRPLLWLTLKNWV